MDHITTIHREGGVAFVDLRNPCVVHRVGVLTFETLDTSPRIGFRTCIRDSVLDGFGFRKTSMSGKILHVVEERLKPSRIRRENRGIPAL